MWADFGRCRGIEICSLGGAVRVGDGLGATGSYTDVVVLSTAAAGAVQCADGHYPKLSGHTHDGTAPFTFPTPVGTGLTFTPVAGQPG
jgi:hypothetical protein